MTRSSATPMVTIPTASPVEPIRKEISPSSRPFKVADLPSIWDVEAKMEWLIEGLVARSSVTLLSGESGCGKSTFALGMAGAVVHGQKFLGRNLVQRDVLIVDRENGAWIYQQRLERLHIAKSPLLHVCGPWSIPQASGPKESDILEFARDNQPLIIFDSLIAFHSGSEQDASETRRYLDDFRKLATEGAAVLLIHHTGKSEGSKEYRGSSDIKASVDAGYLLKSQPGPLQSLSLTPYKSREGSLSPIDITVNEGRFEVSGDRDREVVEAIIRGNPKINQSEIVLRAKDIPENKVRAILETGKGEGRLEVTRGLKNAQLYTLKETE